MEFLFDATQEKAKFRDGKGKRPEELKIGQPAKIALNAWKILKGFPQRGPVTLSQYVVRLTDRCGHGSGLQGSKVVREPGREVADRWMRAQTPIRSDIRT